MHMTYDKIFFILPGGFIRYKKGEGFKEYEKKISGN